MGFIDALHHPLVSARFQLLNALRWTSLRIALLLFKSEGFPEFTRFFNPPYDGKLHILQPPALPTELPGINRLADWQT
jgi:hypothetical protein